MSKVNCVTKLFLAALVLAAVLPGAVCAQYQELQLNKKATGEFQLESNQYYSFSVPANYTSEGFVVILSSTYSRTALSVYVSFTNKEPQIGQSDISCEQSTVVLCFVPREKIGDKSQFFIGVEYHAKVSYAVSVTEPAAYDVKFSDASKPLKASVPVTNDLGERSAAIVRVYVPEQGALPNASSIDSVFVAVLDNSFRWAVAADDTVTAVYKAGKGVPTDAYLRDPFLTLQANDKGLLLSRAAGTLAFGEVYTFLLLTPAGARLDVQALLRDVPHALPDFEGVYDITVPGAPRKYVVTINETRFAEERGVNFSDADINFEVAQFAGRATLAVSLTSFEAAATDPDFYADSAYSKVITIEGAQRPRGTTRFYAIVQSDASVNVSSSYYFDVYSYAYGSGGGAASDIANLDFNYPEFSRVQDDEIAQYRLFAFTGGQAYNITVQLEQLAGGRPQLFARRCNATQMLENCTISREDVAAWRADASASPLIRAQEVVDKVVAVVITHADQEYFYVFAVVGDGAAAANATYSRYALTAQHDYAPLLLRDTVSQYSWLEQGETDYYVFKVDAADGNATSVQFSAFFVQGRAAIYVSTKDSHPSAQNNEYFTLTNTIVISKEVDARDLNGTTFYIAVTALTESSYRLTGIVLRNFGLIPSLFEVQIDQPLPITLSNNTDRIYFTFKVPLKADADKSAQPAISLSVLPQNSPYRLYLSTENTVLLETASMWAPDGQHLYIPPSDDFYNAKDGVYYGAVIADRRLYYGEGTPSGTPFSVFVTTSNAHTTLAVGAPYEDYIEAGETRYFRFLVSPKVSAAGYYLTKRGIDTTIPLVASVAVGGSGNDTAAARAQFPSEKTALRWTSAENIIALSAKEVSDACPSDAQAACYVYAAVRSEQDGTLFSVSLQDRASPVKLVDGVFVHLPYPPDAKTAQRVYFFVQPYQSVLFLQVVTHGVAFSVAANVYAVNSSRTDDVLADLAFPDRGRTNYTFEIVHGALETPVVFHRGDLEAFGCAPSDTCAVLVSAKVKDSEFKKPLPPAFEVGYYTRARTLYVGVPLRAVVETDGVQFYAITLRPNVRRVRVSVTPLDNVCQPVLFVNRGWQNFDDILTNATWRSEDGFLAIDVAPKTQLTVAVYGARGGAFKISYSVGTSQYYALQAGDWHDVVFAANEVAYFSYRHVSGNSNSSNSSSVIKLLSSKVDSSVQVKALAVPSVAQLEDFPSFDGDASKFVWTAPAQQVLTIDKASSPQQYCEDCEYLFAVRSSAANNRVTFALAAGDTPATLPHNRVLFDSLAATGSATQFVYANARAGAKHFKLYVTPTAGEVRVEAASAATGAVLVAKNVTAAKPEIVDIRKKDEDTLNAISVTVTAGNKAPARYSVSLVEVREARTVSPGAPQFDTLANGEQQSYIVPNAQGTLTVNVILLNDEFRTAENAEKQYAPSLRVASAKPMNRTYACAPDATSSRETLVCAITIDKKDLPEFLNVTVFNDNPRAPQEFVLQYKVLITDATSLLLQADGRRITHQMKSGESNTLEVSVATDARVLVQVFECKGSVQLKQYASTDGGRSESPVSVQRPPSRNVFVIQRDITSEQTLFVQAQVTSVYTPLATYRVESRKYEKGTETPYDRLSTGNKGRISTQIDPKTGHINVTISGVYCPECKDGGPQKALGVTSGQYHLVVSHMHEAVQEAVQCPSDALLTRPQPITRMLGVMLGAQDLDDPLLFSARHNVGSAGASAFLNSSESTITFTVPNDTIAQVKALGKNVLYMSVLARVSANGADAQKEYYEFIYDTHDFRVDGSTPDDSGSDGDARDNKENRQLFYVGLAISLGLTVLTAACYCYRRIKRSNRVRGLPTRDTAPTGQSYAAGGSSISDREVELRAHSNTTSEEPNYVERYKNFGEEL